MILTLKITNQTSNSDMHEEDMHKDEDYVPDTDTDSESDSDTSSEIVSSLSQASLPGNMKEFHSTKENTHETTVEATEETTGVSGINYCYVCQKPQSKLARHLDTQK